MENNQFEIKLSWEQLTTLADLVTVEKSREELKSKKACYKDYDKIAILEEIENVLIDAMFL